MLFRRLELEFQDARDGVGAVVGAGVEADRGGGRGSVDGVDDGLEEREGARWQADAGSDDDAVVGFRRELALDHGYGGLVGWEEAGFAIPASVGELFEGEGDARLDLFGGHAGGQGGVGEVDGFWGEAKEDDAGHDWSR